MGQREALPSSFYPFMYLLGVWQHCLEPSTHSCLCPRPSPPELAAIRAWQGLGRELWVFETPCLDPLNYLCHWSFQQLFSNYPKTNGVKPPPFYFCPSFCGIGIWAGLCCAALPRRGVSVAFGWTGLHVHAGPLTWLAASAAVIWEVSWAVDRAPDVTSPARQC